MRGCVFSHIDRYVNKICDSIRYTYLKYLLIQINKTFVIGDNNKKRRTDTPAAGI